MEELAVLWVVLWLFQFFQNGDYISELGIMHATMQIKWVLFPIWLYSPGWITRQGCQFLEFQRFLELKEDRKTWHMKARELLDVITGMLLFEGVNISIVKL
jgi:hypothetical protein